MLAADPGLVWELGRADPKAFASDRERLDGKPRRRKFAIKKKPHY